MGHIPYKLESPEFYKFAQELEFKVDVKADLYVMDPKKFSDLANLKIGVPRGNEELASKVLGVPVKNIYPGAAESLLQMLEIGRIDAFWFERGSTIEMLIKLKIKGVSYQRFPTQPMQAGLAVIASGKGNELKARLDQLLAKAGTAQYLSGLSVYSKLPDSGVVNP